MSREAAWRYRYEPELCWHVVEYVDQLPKKADWPKLEIEPLYALSAPAPSIDAEAVFAKLTRYEPVSAFSEGAMSEAPEGDWLNYDQVWHVIAALSPAPAARMEAERRVAVLAEELRSAASLLETLAEDLQEDDVSAIMMRVMAQRNRAALSDGGRDG